MLHAGLSRPIRGAWIEISLKSNTAGAVSSRAPYGARGLKCYAVIVADGVALVAPHTGRVD